MQVVQCSDHNTKFKIPNTKEEYLAGKLHEEVERLCEHSEFHGTCKFVEVEA